MIILIFLFKIWFFEFDLGILFSFLFGIGIGMALFALIYVLLLLSSIKKSTYIVQVQDMVSDEVVKDIIANTKLEFKDKKLKGVASEIGYCKDLCFDLVNHIALKFFPDSKRPLMELSIDEVLLLSVYISNRLDEVLSHRAIRLIRKVKISQIASLVEVKKTIDDNEIVKATRKYKIAETFKAAKSVINIVNPVFWIRKLVINSLFGVVINKLCLVTISIVGEETYKIYSKNVFNQEATIDTGVDSLISEIDDDLDEDDLAQIEEASCTSKRKRG